MEVNENYKMTKAMQHYVCRPLVEEIQRLHAENAALKHKIEKVIPTVKEAAKRAKHNEPDFNEIAPCLIWACQILSQAAKEQTK